MSSSSTSSSLLLLRARIHSHRRLLFHQPAVLCSTVQMVLLQVSFWISLSVLLTVFQVYPGKPSRHQNVSIPDFIEAKGDGDVGWQLELQDLQRSGQIVVISKPTPSFLPAGCPSCHPNNSVRAVKEKDLPMNVGVEIFRDFLAHGHVLRGDSNKNNIKLILRR